MALSNIFNEPRREITETLVGLGYIAVPLGLDALASYWVAQKINGGAGGAVEYFILGIVLPIALALAIIIISFIHLIGEAFCDYLENYRGIQLRPARRRNR